MVYDYMGSLAASQVPRDDLIRKMKAISRERHIFITAPGGYGKTVAATQWLTSARGKKAKIIIGDAGNDPGTLQKKMAETLLKLTGKPASISDKTITFDRLLEVIKLLPQKSARCYLVIDDVHKLKNEEALSRVPILIERLPGYVRLCLTSRLEPTPRLMKTEMFGVIRKDDLLFTPEEVEWLGAEKGISLETDQISELLKTTGGWAIYLTAILSAGDTAETKNVGLSSSLAQYFDKRVWEEMNSDTKKTLLCLAIPEELSPGLCERLTGHINGANLLKRISIEANTFLALSDTGKDVYRFHDIAREFLLERAERFLGRDEIRRLNKVAAEWYYEQEDYLSGLRHCIYNMDNEGIHRHMLAMAVYDGEMEHASLERTYNFGQPYMDLPKEFAVQIPYFWAVLSFIYFLGGDMTEFEQRMGVSEKKLLDYTKNHPEVLETLGYLSFLLCNTSIIKTAKKISAMLPFMLKRIKDVKAKPRTNTITQNLPFYHRSYRDHSELYELKQRDIKILRDTLGKMIGEDYTVMEQSLIAGIYYERGDLLDAAHHSLAAYRACEDWMHPETVFCAYMILAKAMYATGTSQEADGIMARMENYIESKARFLMPNFKALQTEQAMRSGNTAAAREWLDVYAYTSESRLPFYQMCRHFTTLRAYIAIRDYAQAAAFGVKLQALVSDYKRPLDQIECSLLTAIALRYDGEQKKAALLFEQAAANAMPYGFTQLFVYEGKEALPMLLELAESQNKPPKLIGFANRLIDAIHKKHNISPREKETAPKLTPQQSAMLTFLSKGMTYNDIAAQTGIGYGTVKYHVLLVYKKLGVHSAQEAVAKAKALGML